MVTEVDAGALTRLLDLQAEDTTLRRLEDRKASLPEAKRLAEVAAALDELEADAAIARAQLQERTSEQNKLEGEIAMGDEKIAREQGRLFSGSVANPKELASLKAEVDMLNRKRSEMEDALLEVLVLKDQVTESLQRIEAELAETTAERDRLEATVRKLLDEIDADIATHGEARGTVAATIGESLLSLYEKLRVAKNGVGAAALENGTCRGCHTKLPAQEIERLRAAGGLQRCDNCRRILVVL